MRKILIVEDNIDLARKLEYTLQWKELDAVVVNSGYLALSYIRECVSDLVILDADLQDFDGFELCRRLRKLHQRPFPILMICTRQALADRVAGLDAGADDYLVKPFDLAELLARVRAALRRINEIMGSNGHLEIDDLVMETAGRQAWRAGIPLELSKREYDLLELLARNAGKVLTKSCIFENVWGYDTDVGWEVIKVYINYLRAKINTSNKPDLIHAVRGVGYVLRP